MGKGTPRLKQLFQQIKGSGEGRAVIFLRSCSGLNSWQRTKPPLQIPIHTSIFLNLVIQDITSSTAYPQIAGNFCVEQAPICRAFRAIRSGNIPIWKWRLMAGGAAFNPRAECRMAQKYRTQTLGLNAAGFYNTQSWKLDENLLFFHP